MKERPKTIGEVSRASGVSPRTLRYYEERGLLRPARTEAGYRLYTAADERRLAHIMAMRSCGLPLTAIEHIMGDDEPNIHGALLNHLRTLRAQEKSLDAALHRTQAALHTIEGITNMSTEDAFEKLKQQGLKSFEETYGREARARYGSAVIDATNERMMALSRDEWDAKELLEESIKVQLRLALAGNDPASEEAAKLARMHERWIAIHWGPGYGKDEYLGLVRGYLADPRFTAYYDDAAGPGATDFLVKAVEAYQGSTED